MGMLASSLPAATLAHRAVPMSRYVCWKTKDVAGDQRALNAMLRKESN